MNKRELMEDYSANDMSKLKKLAHSVFYKYGGIDQSQYDDLYSIANIELWKATEKFDVNKHVNFEKYLKGNIERKYRTYLRDIHRDQRCMKYVNEYGEVVYEKELRIDAPLKDGEDGTFGDLIEAKEKQEDGDLHPQLEKYIKRLNKTQKDLLFMLADGVPDKRIKDTLGIDTGKFNMLLDDLRSIRRTSSITHLYKRV